MPRGTERPIRTNQEVSNPPRSKEVPAKNPLSILKERFSFLPPLEIKSADWHKEEAEKYLTQSNALYKKYKELPEGSQDSERTRYLSSEARNNYHINDHINRSMSSEDECTKEIEKANAMRSREFAKQDAYLAQAEDYPAKPPGRQKKRDSVESARLMTEALQFTILQVQKLVRAERLAVGSENRQKMERDAQKFNYMAKEWLYLAREDYYKAKGDEWLKERREQEHTTWSSALEEGFEVEIEFPEWINKEIEKLESKTLPAEQSYRSKFGSIEYQALEEHYKAKRYKLMRHKHIEKLELKYGFEVETKFSERRNKEIEELRAETEVAEQSSTDKLRPIASVQAERLFPDATEDQKEEIISGWMKTKRKELVEVGNEWNEEVDYWMKEPAEVMLPDMTPKEQKKIALKRAYAIWTDPYRIEHAFIEQGWGKEIVKAVWIP